MPMIKPNHIDPTLVRLRNNAGAKQPTGSGYKNHCE